MIKKRWELQKLFIFLQLLITPFLGMWLISLRDWNTLVSSSVGNCTADVVGMLVLLMLFFSCVKDRNDLSYRTGYFTYLVSINGWALFLDLISWLVDGIPSLRLVNLIGNEIYYILGLMVIMIFWHYLVEVSELEDPRLTHLTKVLNIGAFITLLAIVGNLAGRYYFDVNAEGVYSRQRFYPSSQLYSLLMLICVLFLILKMDLSKKKRRALLTFIVAPFATIVIQMLFYGISVTYIGLLISLIAIYGNVFTEQNRELIEKRVENLQKERVIMLAREEQQRMETELSLAAQIQTHMIPTIFPPFPDRKEFSLYASMTPAREVGGDFFDFFFVDKDHLALVIADVSGKGIPAALYMMVSKTMLKNAAMQGMSPKQILETVNQQLCEGVEEVQMFVTVWIGIIDLSTGKMTAANAGHEYPAICRKNGSFELFKDKHGLVLGAMEGMRYREYEMVFQEGDTLFVYTDGVAEANDPDNHLFGVDNMLKALNKEAGAEVEGLLKNVRDDIEDFAFGAEQFDDITMLAFRLEKLEGEK
ncbi:MAG: serine/threonine-protein phosphatase [Lachnospiraceae bacterium]|nr:serine/threonine-protein phosphatase [Lachnospiraceae bacterium]